MADQPEVPLFTNRPCGGGRGKFVSYTIGQNLHIHQPCHNRKCNVLCPYLKVHTWLCFTECGYCRTNHIHGRIQRGTGCPDHLKTQKYRFFFKNSDPEPLKNQASIQCWAIIVPPAKRHLNDVSLAGR